MSKKYRNVIYISGQITGLNPSMCERIFSNTEEKLTKRCAIFLSHREHAAYISVFTKVINPLKLPVLFKNWYSYMTVDLFYLIFKADSILLLTNWETSKGAKIEHKVAIFFKKGIYFEDEML